MYTGEHAERHQACRGVCYTSLECVYLSAHHLCHGPRTGACWCMGWASAARPLKTLMTLIPGPRNVHNGWVADQHALWSCL